MVSGQRAGSDGKRPINCVGARVRTECVAIPRLGGARDDGPAFGRACGSPTQRDCSPTRGCGVGSQPNVTRRRVLHALVAEERTQVGSVTGLSTGCNSATRLTMA